MLWKTLTANGGVEEFSFCKIWGMNTPVRGNSRYNSREATWQKFDAGTGGCMRFSVKIVQKFYVMHGRVVLSVLYYFPSSSSMIYIRCPCKVFELTLYFPVPKSWLTLAYHFFLISKCYIMLSKKQKQRKRGINCVIPSVWDSITGKIHL